MPRAVRLPYVDFAFPHGLPGTVLERAKDEEGFALVVVGDLGAVLQVERFMCVEGAEDCAVSAAGGLGVVYAIDEEGEAEHIGEEDEFLQACQYTQWTLEV